MLSNPGLQCCKSDDMSKNVTNMICLFLWLNMKNLIFIHSMLIATGLGKFKKKQDGFDFLRKQSGYTLYYNFIRN